MRVVLSALVLLVACNGGEADSDAGERLDTTRQAAAVEDSGAQADASVETDAAVGTGAGSPASVCPPGSDTFVVDLSSASLSPVAGVPIDDGFVTGLSIVEGPLWNDGALYMSHFAFGAVPVSRIYRLEPVSGAVTIASPDAGVNGLAVGVDGNLYGGRHTDGSISRFEWADLSADPAPVVAEYLSLRFNSPNDLVFRADGTLFFTDASWLSPMPEPQAEERAYRVGTDGNITLIPNPPSRPNGIMLSLDERTLFVSGTSGLSRYGLDAAGNVTSGPDTVAGVGGGLDGLALDCAGNLYVTGGDRVVVLSSELAVLGELAARGATNAAFGGADRRTLYVTTLGTTAGLLEVRLNVPGFPY